MIYSIMAFICVTAILYFIACIIVNWIQYEDEDSAVMKVTVIIGIIYLVGLASGWWTVRTKTYLSFYVLPLYFYLE